MAIVRLLLHVISYSVALYLLDTYTTIGGVDFIFSVQNWQGELKIYALLGVVFWFAFAVIKRVISFFAFPFQLLTLGVAGIVINIAIFYLCQYIVNTYLVGITMQIGSLGSLCIVSLILSVIVSFVYWVLKQII